MDPVSYKGIISFINHHNENMVIDYEAGGKKKAVNFRPERPDQSSNTNNRSAKKQHAYRIGDTISFKVRLNDRGDKMIAYDTKFLFNTAIEKLAQKAAINNNFTGYLKMIDDKLYVKEMDSYLFFPLLISKWEKAPAPLNEAVRFRLLNSDKPNSISAELQSRVFIPEFKKAMHHLKSKKPVEAVVTRTSEYAVYIDLFDGKIQTKLTINTGEKSDLNTGDPVKVVITYLSTDRIVVAFSDMPKP